MPEELPPQIDPSAQIGSAEQQAQLPQLPEAVAAMLPEVARMKLLTETREAGMTEGYSAGAVADRHKIERMWEEATGSKDGDQFEADLEGMDAIIAASGGPLAYLEALKRAESKSAKAGSMGSFVTRRLFGRK